LIISICSAGESVSLVLSLISIAEKCLNHRFTGFKDDTDSLVTG